MAYYLAIISPQDSPLYEALFSTSKNPSSLIPASSSTGLGGGAATTLHSFPAWSTIAMGLPAESKAILEKAAAAAAKGETFDPFPASMLGGPGSTSGAAAAGKNELGVEMHMLQMIAYSSLDSVEDVMTGNGSQYLRSVDKYNEWLVSAFVAPNVKFVLLHDIRNEEGIRLFFMDVWESYVKVALNPFHTTDALLGSQAFENKVRASARKNL